MRGRLISFIGIDGSGKTTLIKNINKRLRDRGIRFRYVWGAYELQILRPIIIWGKHILLRGRCPNPKEDYRGYISSLNKVGENKALLICYQIALFIEYVFQILFKITLPLMIGRNIISDRYIFDTVINLKVNLNLEEKTMFRIIDLLLKVVPTPDMIIFVDVSEEIAFSRKDDTPSIDYLRERRNLYKKVADQYSAIFVDGTKPVEVLCRQLEEVIKYLEEKRVN